ncbi:hypothetical protein Bbelb_315040 [Branchiostoma belcheri]|nr:hypothetical protein Bbelb_315040 [Branchiostoma belcheri]
MPARGFLLTGSWRHACQRKPEVDPVLPLHVLQTVPGRSGGRACGNGRLPLVVRGFNLDTDRAAVRSGPEGSFFGFSVAMHRTPEGRKDPGDAVMSVTSYFSSNATKDDGLADSIFPRGLHAGYPNKLPSRKRKKFAIAPRAGPCKRKEPVHRGACVPGAGPRRTFITGNQSPRTERLLTGDKKIWTGVPGSGLMDCGDRCRPPAETGGERKPRGGGFLWSLNFFRFYLSGHLKSPEVWLSVWVGVKWFTLSSGAEGTPENGNYTMVASNVTMEATFCIKTTHKSQG